MNTQKTLFPKTTIFRKNSSIIFAVLVMGFFAIAHFSSVANAADTTPPADGGTVSCSSGTPVAGVCFPSNTGLPDKPVADILTNVLNWLLGIFTTIAIIAFVISGFQYLTSAGDDTQIETAKKNMKWSIVGVLVGLSGYVILQAVQAALTASSSAF